MINKAKKIEEEENVFPTEALERLHEELKKIIEKSSINRSNIITIVISLMQIVEKYQDVSGVQKKAIILKSLELVINDQISDEEEAKALNLLVEVTLPTLIDTVVSIDKKEIQIKIKKGCSKLLQCCRN
jgi:hypothetical protein